MVRSRPKGNNLTQQGLILATGFNRNPKIAHLVFATEYEQRQFGHWTAVLFADESRFFLTQYNGTDSTMATICEQFQQLIYSS